MTPLRKIASSKCSRIRWYKNSPKIRIRLSGSRNVGSSLDVARTPEPMIAQTVLCHDGSKYVFRSMSYFADNLSVPVRGCSGLQGDKFKFGRSTNHELGKTRLRTSSTGNQGLRSSHDVQIRCTSEKIG